MSDVLARWWGGVVAHQTNNSRWAFNSSHACPNFGNDNAPIHAHHPFSIDVTGSTTTKNRFD
jgi:hypothetical protein